MRVFIALNLPERTKDNLERSANQFKTHATKGRFVPKANYHVTLHFIGNIDENRLLYVHSALDGVREMIAPRLAVSQFTVLRASNIVCAKFGKNENLAKLHEALGNKLEQTGFAVEHRAYRPHVTIIREYGFELPFSEVTKFVDVYNKPFDAPEVVLYESVSGKDGVTYRPLYAVMLETEE